MNEEIVATLRATHPPARFTAQDRCAWTTGEVGRLNPDLD